VMLKRLAAEVALLPLLVEAELVEVIQSNPAYLHQVVLLFRLGQPVPVRSHLYRMELLVVIRGLMAHHCLLPLLDQRVEARG
jgi:hypothetical protein